MIKVVQPGIRSGSVHIPASKSDAQRAYLAAALANGISVLKGFGNSEDEQAMLVSIKNLGANVTISDEELHITGITTFPQKITLNAGESGLGIRLLTPVCAAHEGQFCIEGKGSLTSRPMQFYDDVLPKFGAKCTSRSGYLPLVISGPLSGGNATVSGALSSQFISGLLMALPLSQGDSTLSVERLNSRPYVNMTLKTLSAFGIQITEHDSTFNIPGNQRYQPTEYTIDADWSSAGYWLVAGALGHPIILLGLNPDSLQADKALLGFLEKAGCEIVTRNGEISVNGTNKRPFSVDATDCPDLFPTLAVLAAACIGISEISGVSRLEHKESHRGLTVQSEFAKLGVRIDLSGDTMRIHGTGHFTSGNVAAHHDHRIAMSLAIAATIAQGPVTIDQAEAVGKSYSDFWKTFEAL